MNVLRATITQKKKLEGTYKNGSVLQFIKDANGEWVVNDAVIYDKDFAEIKKQLQLLQIIEFIPIINDTI